MQCKEASFQKYSALQCITIDYFSQFEKRFGSRQSVEDIVWNKRRTKYEDKLAQSPNDYDTWFDYLRMVEESEKYFFNHFWTVESLENYSNQEGFANSFRQRGVNFWEYEIFSHLN